MKVQLGLQVIFNKYLKAQEFVRQERVFICQKSLARLQVETKSNPTLNQILVIIERRICLILVKMDAVIWIPGEGPQKVR